MNMHVITPTDLKKFQIESYSEMLKNPLSDNHKKFLKNQIKKLQNGKDNDCRCYSTDNYFDASHSRGKWQKEIEKI